MPLALGLFTNRFIELRNPQLVRISVIYSQENIFSLTKSGLYERVE
jgi:hypothetical protein